MINLSVSQRRQPVILYHSTWCYRKHTAYFSMIDLEINTSHLTFRFILIPQQCDASPPYPLSLPALAKITHESLRARSLWLSSILPPHWAYWLSLLGSVFVWLPKAASVFRILFCLLLFFLLTLIARYTPKDLGSGPFSFNSHSQLFYALIYCAKFQRARRKSPR